MLQSVDFPLYRENEPVQWFAEMEDCFRKFGVVTASGKCAAVAAAVAGVSKVPGNARPCEEMPPGQPQPYELLKGAMLSQWVEEKNTVARPSDILMAMWVRNPQQSDKLVRERWLRALPCRLRFVLEGRDGCEKLSNSQIALLADRIMDLVGEVRAEEAACKAAAVQTVNSGTELIEEHIKKIEGTLQSFASLMEDKLSSLKRQQKTKTVNETGSATETDSEYSSGEFSGFESEEESELSDMSKMTADYANSLVEEERSNGSGKKVEENSSRAVSCPILSVVTTVAPAPEMPSSSGAMKNIENNSHKSVPGTHPQIFVQVKHSPSKPSENIFVSIPAPSDSDNGQGKNAESSFSGTETKDTGIDSSDCEPKNQDNGFLLSESAFPALPNGGSLNKTSFKNVSLGSETANNNPSEPKLSQQPSIQTCLKTAPNQSTASKSSQTSLVTTVEPSANKNSELLESLKKIIEDTMTEIASRNNKRTEKEEKEKEEEALRKNEEAEKKEKKEKKKPVAFICYYHARFGRNSYRCRSPCEFDELSSEDM